MGKVKTSLLILVCLIAVFPSFSEDKEQVYHFDINSQDRCDRMMAAWNLYECGDRESLIKLKSYINDVLYNILFFDMLV